MSDVISSPSPPDLDRLLEGSALVTGASRGIGRAVSEALADRGFRVVATMRDTTAGRDLADRPDGRVELQRLDVCDPTTISPPEDLAVVVNNAGVECDYLPIEHAPMDQWRRVMETNLFGLVEVIRRAVPIMRANGGGVICNITSSSLLVPMPFYGIYRASKAAVAALGESLAAEVAPFGIRVVEVLPGPIATDMLAGSARLPEAAEHDGYEELARAALDGRMAVDDLTTSPQDAAAAVVGAICDPASGLKHGCDPMSVDLLEAWERSPGSMFGDLW